MPKRNESSYSSWSGSDLRDVRKSLGFTGKVMSEMLGVSERQYAYYESGQIRVDKPLEYAVRWLHDQNMYADRVVPSGALSHYDKERIDKLLDVIENRDVFNMDDYVKRILSQCKSEISMLLSKVA